MKRAVILIPCLLTGGTEIATMDTAKALSEQGYAVSVIVYFNETESAMVDAFRQKNIHVDLLNLVRGGGLVGSLKLGLALARRLWKLRPELVWVQYMTPTLVPLIVSRVFTRYLISAVHVAARHYSPSGLRRLRWLASWWCRRLVCVSETTAKGILGEKPGKRLERAVTVIPNALDMQAVTEATPYNWRIHLGIPESQAVIGFVGRLADIKGVDTLLAAANMVNQIYLNTHWIIVGDGSKKLMLQKQTTEFGLDGKVHFVGAIPRESVYAAMKGFDIAVVPSREEGFGLTALEAMACGVPLVASRVDALNEVVKDGVTGLLFAVGCASDLAEKIKLLIASSSMCDSLAREASDRARSMYGHVRFSGLIAEMVKNLDKGIHVA